MRKAIPRVPRRIRQKRRLRRLMWERALIRLTEAELRGRRRA